MIKKSPTLYFYIFILFLSTLKLIAQVPNFYEEHLLFIDHKNQSPVLIIGDSTTYQGYDFIKSPPLYLSNEIPLKDFKAIEIEGQTYVVDKGCGPVFKLNSRNFTRVDKSFRHRNQYNANIFTYKNRIHFFGGYGMFTEKNIITYFDETIGEWFELPVHSEAKPAPRSNANAILINNNYYLWGGAIKDDIIFSRDIDNNSIWMLNLETGKWENLGFVTKQLSLMGNIKINFIVDNNLYAISFNSMYKFDLSNNLVTEYKFNMPNLLDGVYDKYSNSVILIKKSTDDGSKSIVIKSLDELSQNKVYQSTFYKKNNSFNLIWVAIGILIILICLFFYTKSKTLKIGQKNKLIYSKKEDTFFMNGKPINLESKLKVLFLYLVNEQDNYILLDGINELFSNGNTQESHVTINKRRDIAIKKLKYILSLNLNKSEDEIILEKRSKNDKRVKEIKLGIVVDIIN